MTLVSDPRVSLRMWAESPVDPMKQCPMEAPSSPLSSRGAELPASS
jgi:hypothetical protein